MARVHRFAERACLNLRKEERNYPTGTTYSNPSGAYYTSSYDAWGNVSSRSYSGISATLSYDLLDHFTQWYVSSTNQEQYVYDSSGTCI